MSIDNKRRIENLSAIIGLSSNGVKALDKAEQWVTNNCPDHIMARTLLSGVWTLRAQVEREIAECTALKKEAEAEQGRG